MQPACTAVRQSFRDKILPKMSSKPLIYRFELSPAQVQTVISDNNLTYDAIVSCLTPDLSLQLNNPNKNYTDTFVAITEFDGTYRLD